MITNSRTTPAHFAFIAVIRATNIVRGWASLEQKLGFIVGESWSVLSTEMLRIVKFVVLLPLVDLFLLEMLFPFRIFIATLAHVIVKNRSARLALSTPLTIAIGLGVTGGARLTTITVSLLTTHATVLTVLAYFSIGLVGAIDALAVKVVQMFLELLLGFEHRFISSPYFNGVL
jgi:hypothetical protein